MISKMKEGAQVVKTLNFNKIGVIDKYLLDKISPEKIPNIISQPSIYHYTSINGIKEILRSKKLWFTHIDYMNDRDEVIAGAEQLRKVGLENYAGQYSEILKSEAEQISKQDHKAFVCCFSQKRDELSMWNYYTKDINNQGYNLGFDYKKLVVSVLKNNPEIHGCKFTFGKVDYCINEDTYATQMYHNSIDNISEALLKFASLICNEKVDDSILKKDKPEYPFVKYYGEEPIFRRAPSLDVLFLMKRPCFSVEEEFRIVIQVTKDALVELEKRKKYKYRISNGLLVPYLDLDIDTDALSGATLSPTVNQDLAERSIKDYCNFCNIDINVLSEGIVKSKIPVRF